MVRQDAELAIDAGHDDHVHLIGEGAALRRDDLELEWHLAHLLRVGFDVLDLAGHEEGLLGELVVLALEDLSEAPHRLLELDVHAWPAGELLAHEEWLRHEALKA